MEDELELVRAVLREASRLEGLLVAGEAGLFSWLRLLHQTRKKLEEKMAELSAVYAREATVEDVLDARDAVVPYLIDLGGEG